MNDHIHAHQPPTLREVLDRGEGLTKHISIESFVEARLHRDDGAEGS
ncbi:MAG TPA: hypothetical protein VM282_04250 [Acidimicrobiales bacterium]|nr:hypothetical protein [Acidimicrobiales bacterium]